jgi:hypothetical protein
MNVPWMGAPTPCPIVEFHDVRTEKFRSDAYLSLVENRLIPPLLAAGAFDLGHFSVESHPDRLVLLRGFTSMGARRRALTAFHAGESWQAHRADAAALVRNVDVILTRTIAPADGVRMIRAGETLTAVISEVRFPEQLGNYHLWLRLLLRKAGMDPVLAFATLEAVNDVPAVPIVRNRSQHIALVRGRGPTPQLPPELRGMLRFSPEVLTLQPALSLVW